MSKPRILIFINSLQTGGSERVVSLLLQSLNDDFEIHLAMYTALVEYSIPPEIKIIDLKQPLYESKLKLFLKAPAIARKMAKYCKKNDIRTSIAFLYRGCYINALMKVRFGYKGFVIMCERTHQSAILQGYSWLVRKITRRLIRYSYQQADLVLANSYVMQNDLIHHLHINTPTRVIYNPIDIEFIEQQCEEIPDIHFEDGIFYFISVAGFRREKNHLLLIQAFFLLRKLPCKLIIIGKGTEEAACREQVKNLEIEDRVIFTGFQRNPFKYLCRSECFVLSSDVEGFPNVLIEALACGLPVISTDCFSGPRELLAPDTDIYHEAINHYELAEFGILTPVNDVASLGASMKRMFDDEKLRADLRSKAKLRAKDFHVDDIKELFHVVFSSRGSI